MEAKTNHDLVNSIIQEKMILAMGAGVIPVPVVDFLAVSAIQVAMVRQISRAYGINYKESEGKALITSLAGAGMARWGGSLMKSVPGIGTLLGGATTSVLSGASTYAIGEVFKIHFEKGGTFLDFDLSSLKKYYDQKFEKGKDVASKMKKKEQKNEDTSTSIPKTEVPEDLIPRLKEYAQLKAAGVLTEEEYLRLKARLLGK